MGANLFARAILFVSSYSPLVLIFCILFADKHRLASVILLVGGILSVLFLAFYFQYSRRTIAASMDKVTDFQRHDADVMGYIASYLIPFVTFPLDNLQETLGLAVFVVVLLVVYVNSNMIYINPVLNLAGYHLYEIHIEHSELSHYLITRKRVVLNETIHFVRLSDDIFLEKREKVK